MKFTTFTHWLPGHRVSELVELHKLVTDSIASEICSIPSGGKSYPFESLVITVFTQDDSLSAVVQQSWIEQGELEKDLRRLFTNMDVTVPDGFRVEIKLSNERSTEPFRITRVAPQKKPNESVESAPASADTMQETTVATAAAPSKIHLRVVSGSTEDGATEFEFAAQSILIGRRREVLTDTGRLKRSNHIGLSDSAVSRAHCQLRWNATRGRYCLLDQKSVTGTQIVRSGEPYEAPRIGEGFAVAEGDQIRMGRVAIAVDKIEVARTARC